MDIELEADAWHFWNTSWKWSANAIKLKFAGLHDVHSSYNLTDMVNAGVFG